MSRLLGKYFFIILWILPLCLGGGFLYAENAQTAEVNTEVLPRWLDEENKVPQVSAIQLVLRSGLALVVVLIAILGLILLLRAGLSKVVPENRGNIKLISKYYLSPKSFVCIIEVDSRRYLLGVAEGSVSLISELGPDRQFASLMKEEMSGFGNSGRNEYIEFIEEINNQIQELKQAIKKRVGQA